MNRRRLMSLALTLAAIESVSCNPLDARVTRPPEFVGRWARLTADTTWGDTVQFLAGGGFLASNGQATDSTGWAVVHTRFMDALCIGPRGKPHCQQFRMEGDTLLHGDQQKMTYYRRAH